MPVDPLRETSSRPPEGAADQDQDQKQDQDQDQKQGQRQDQKQDQTPGFRALINISRHDP
ncbi:hypothetical protein FJD37_17200 [Pseudomonas saxonica]|uniref:Uncharacterized protein n=1 Tax=Pseudomonas saxonica TaxID=2600598 RepID=A0A5C5PTM8_9PSED|nr:hypothetical protein FJD37_17200 [Pseudomonas saxonica]